MDHVAEPDFTEIDLSRHDFAALRADINDIVDIPRAIGQTLRWALLLPVIGTWLTWVVFADRMSIWVRVPYVALVAAGLVLAAVSIGGLVVLRSRVVEVDEAADRVIATVAAVHGDYIQIRSSESEPIKRELAAVVAKEVVFPALLASGDAAFGNLPVSGALAFVARPLLKYPLAMIERRVLDVLALDDVELTPETIESGHVESDRAEPEVTSADLVAAAALADLPPELADWYGSIHRYLSKAVAGAGTIAVGSMWGIVAVSSAPVVILLLLGWLVT